MAHSLDNQDVEGIVDAGREAGTGDPQSPDDVCRRTFDEKDFPYARVAVVSPHPDDSVLGCGGLLHKLRKLCPAIEIHCLVMTPGFRGVVDEFLRTHPQTWRKDLRTWLGVNAGTSAEALRKDVEAAVDEQLGAGVFARFENKRLKKQSPDIDCMLNVIRTAIRREESRQEAAELRLDLDKEWHFLNLTDLYERRITAGELSVLRSLLHKIRVPGRRNLIITPHQDDIQSAHRVATEITLAALSPSGIGDGGESGHLDWDVWFYQSPWFSIPAADIDVVVSLDETDMATKKAAAAQHTSQLDRTPYTDFVEAAGRINADVLPELLLGFGLAKFQQFGPYCEVYQTRMHEFYHPDEPDVVVYQESTEESKGGGSGDILDAYLD